MIENFSCCVEPYPFVDVFIYIEVSKQLLS